MGMLYCSVPARSVSWVEQQFHQMPAGEKHLKYMPYLPHIGKSCSYDYRVTLKKTGKKIFLIGSISKELALKKINVCMKTIKNSENYYLYKNFTIHLFHPV